MRQDSPTKRYAEVDILKALGIAAVVLTHALRDPWNPNVSPGELWIGKITRFGVPGFLACSGFLYASSAGVSVSMTLRRVKRIAIPYLLASLGAQIWWLSQDRVFESAAFVRELALAASFGQYYYVLVIFSLVLVTPLFAVLPRAVLGVLTFFLFCSQGWLESGGLMGLNWFWQTRNPLLWYAYFLLGWLIRLNYEGIHDTLVGRRAESAIASGIAVGLCVAAMSFSDSILVVRIARWLNIYAVIALSFALTCGRADTGALVRLVSDASYSVYLFHLFFLVALRPHVRPVFGELDLPVIGIHWSVALLGSLAIVLLSRALLGRDRSRTIIGA